MDCTGSYNSNKPYKPADAVFLSSWTAALTQQAGAVPGGGIVNGYTPNGNASARSLPRAAPRKPRSGSTNNVNFATSAGSAVPALDHGGFLADHLK
jgi:hypothetical protein